MNHSEYPVEHARTNPARSPYITSAVRSSPRKRTRIAGSKNLKNREWVLVHQHFLRRNRENKATVFVIHGVEYQWHNVRRKITRASAALKEPLVDSEPMSPLPWYIELRSPSPELISPPSVSSVDMGSNLVSSLQRTEEDMRLQSSQATSDTQNHDFSLEDEEKDIETAGNSFLGDLKVSEIFDMFRKPNWRKPPSSYVILFGVAVLWEDTLQTFANRLNDARGDTHVHISHLQAVLKLIRRDHVSTGHLLETVVRNLGGRSKEVLEWLASKTHIPEYGARALGAAAHSNNFEAVDTLLSRGVDINANVSGPHSTPDCRCQIRVIDYAQLLYFNGEETRVSDEMIAYLFDRGAEESTGLRMCLLGLLVCVLRQQDEGPESSSLLVAQSYIRLIHDFAKAMGQTESFLQTWIHETDFGNSLHMARDSLLEELLTQSTENFSISPLITIIYKNARCGLVERLLARTENINVYCNSVSVTDSFTKSATRPHPYKEIRSISPLQAAALLGRESALRVLLQNGADVNCPARGSCGVTPLQAICWWNTELPQDHEMKLRIVAHLLDKGANVNAAPAWQFGLSALQAAAFVGDKHVAVLLVSKGADINAPASKYGGGTALAMAAEQGHAHVVRYLLKAGAMIPPASVATPISDTTYQDKSYLLHFIRACVTELAANGSSNERPPRDYREYEAEWAGDPTYDNRD